MAFDAGGSCGWSAPPPLLDRTPDSSSGIASDDPCPASPGGPHAPAAAAAMTMTSSSARDVIAAGGATPLCYRYSRHSDMTRRHVTRAAPVDDVTAGTSHVVDNLLNAHTHTHTHPFNCPSSGTTRVSRYQRGKTNVDFTDARDGEWQWRQLTLQCCLGGCTERNAPIPTIGAVRVLWPGHFQC